MKLSNFWQRLITGTGFVVILSGAVIWGQLSCMALMLLINIFCLNEFYSLFDQNRFFKYAGMISGSLVFILVSFYAAGLLPANMIMLLFPVIFLFFIPLIFDHSADLFRQPAIMLLGIAYISVPLCLFVMLGFISIDGSYNFQFPMAALVLTWINDTMAYVSGSLMGKHKFYEKLSPKKTWEGIIGGLIFTALFSLVLYWLIPEISWIHWLALALIVSVFAIIGDLFESRLKRGLNIKDSGNVLPGHGGLLDRFDAMLFVVPFYFLYIFFIIF